MTTAVKALLDVAKAALLAGTPDWAEHVYVGLDADTPLHANADINVSIENLDGTPFALTAGPTDWQADLLVALRARGSDTVNAMDAADPLAEDVYARLGGMTLPAGVIGVDSYAVRMGVQEAAEPFAEWQFRLSLTFRTAPGSLSLAA